MSTLFNVTGLHHDSVSSDIRRFINSFTSKHTQRTYERNICTFMMWYANKMPEQLVPEDLPIKNAQFVEYQTHLRNHALEYENTTINNMVDAIRSLYVFLQKNEYNVKSINLDIKSLIENPQHAGSLFPDEAENMAQLVVKQRKGVEKAALIRMAYTTSLRKSSLLDICFKDITYNDQYGYYEFNVLVKGGKKIPVSIPTWLYEELLTIKEQDYYKQYTDDKVFHLRNKAIQAMMDSLRVEMNIPKERNIVFHSFRNVVVKVGSIQEAKEQLGHSNIATTDKFYKHMNMDLSNRPSMRMHNKIPDNVFHSLSKEELISLILNDEAGTIMRMKLKADEIVKQKEVL
ncbi:site-specific integrase [Paenibacillus sp. O199]|uniref:tyrosine-type recombinase/integrase n=1 Tax=Paenibacillus sp. O199 TaxID=1643925 RepID=UPI0007BED6D8|nr:site-specific integrase [Paenibacillus sp. O199]